MAISELDLPAGVVARQLADGTALAEGLAEHVAEVLRQAVEADGLASLLVSGGRSPIPFFEALSAFELDWSRVQVGLVDERWVAPDQDGSNEALVRRHLLRGPAAEATFLGLYQPAATLEAAARQAGRALEPLKRPVDMVVLGMGEDGHTASLFPGSPNLAQALAGTCAEPCMAMLAPVAPHPRISLTWPVLARARRRCLAIQGISKLETLRQALRADPLRMPIRAFLNDPLEIYWSP
ncbi:6-phosphogluconolactonase [Azotobacter beijerinckii]|uniref:6-phosphogluconolactonase n=1 Tax=Azotobacter beijerinckii TaxID=170623 RepID=A0A1I4JKB9_9GAMM|nr:6-phosphogluconolactonase [Azotobacter beijerinckii]SFB65658.1 6-phosphogluconolactonase [Azotobacter beijerinckii]SFL67045.1 6-phosphogluconolactonase [Azotobacter beijerinckii]